jgi:hypothetical protein
MLENREIFLFQNIRQVIKAELWCVKSKIEVKVIPVPKPYSTECGLCLELCGDHCERLELFAKESGMEVQRINPNKPTEKGEFV